MSLSSATVTVSNTQITPARIKFNGVDLGGTKGGVSFIPKPEYADIVVDQYGKTPLDKKLSGYAMTCKFELAEVQLKDNWKVAFPSLKLVTSGPNKAIYSDLQIGDGLLSHASTLLIHPLDHSDSDLSGDITCYKAAAISTPELKFTPDNQIVLSVEMILFPDTSVSPPRMFFFGDPAVGTVAASAGSAVAGTNTGNGTVTSISTGTATKTETITITCEGAPAANKSNWYVSGSVSGPLGIVQITAGTVGGSATFTSNAINFTITDGTVDFVAGDSFTIATTGANYA